MSALLPVMEHFYTIQGEGAYQGNAAYFIRIGGCDVQCPWCDVKESWDAAAHKKYSEDTILSWVKEADASLVVITGGEPSMYDLTSLTSSLKSNGVNVNIETAANHALRGTFDWITISPKRYSLPLTENLLKANELKVIINHRNDFRFAEQYEQMVSSECKLFLQPEWEQDEDFIPLIIDYVKRNPQWRISLQIHKFMNIP
jgi:7-carboxy-7-deazaguanine synthase